MEILRRLAWFAGSVIVIITVFSAGVWSGAASIQRSCDNLDEARTVINGHAYFCGDFDTVSRALAVIRHGRGA